jgi:hypothetical protein
MKRGMDMFFHACPSRNREKQLGGLSNVIRRIIGKIRYKKRPHR